MKMVCNFCNVRKSIRLLLVHINFIFGIINQIFLTQTLELIQFKVL